jgi:hypothetical protein
MAREVLQNIHTILGWTPSVVIIGEHSAGGDTALSNMGLIYKDVNGERTSQSLPSLGGGGTIVGTIGCSLQGRNNANYDDSWDALDTTHNGTTLRYIIMTGSADGQENHRVWSDRKAAYNESTVESGLFTLVNGHHQYGGFGGRAGTSQHWADWLQLAYVTDCHRAFADWLLFGNAAGKAWLENHSFRPTDIKLDAEDRY